MANFPFKDGVGFIDHINTLYPELDYTKVYYMKINGSIMAVKPIAFGIYGLNDRLGKYTWTHSLKVLAADGNEYDNLSISGGIFPTARDAIKYEKDRSGEKVRLIEISQFIEAKGGTIRYGSLRSFSWNKEIGAVVEVRGGYYFWEDIDGKHLVFQEMTGDGRKIYKNEGDCVDENVKVLEFGGSVTTPKGVYTVKREFTVEAESEEDAEAIVDDALFAVWRD